MSESLDHTFLGLPAQAESGTGAVVVIPVPYDGTSTWRRGSDAGPAALLEASTAVELYDVETGLEPWRAGIRTLPPLSCPPEPEAMSGRRPY